MQLKATSFATRQDLAAFCRAVTQGQSPREALSVGDNGLGAWGEPTWHVGGEAICALHSEVAAHNQRVSVKLENAGHGQAFICIVKDRAPRGVVDLNPAALIAAGLNADAQLSATATINVLSE